MMGDSGDGPFLVISLISRACRASILLALLDRLDHGESVDVCCSPCGKLMHR